MRAEVQAKPHRPKKPKRYDWNGRKYPLAALARMHGKTPGCLFYRMDVKGQDLHEALAEPNVRAPGKVALIGDDHRLDCEVSEPGEKIKRFAWQGTEMTIKELVAASQIGISRQALWGRLINHWTLARAMTEPVKRKR